VATATRAIAIKRTVTTVAATADAAIHAQRKEDSGAKSARRGPWSDVVP
jgi:hypothetical protein